jgi:methylenetetrahydrofolate reductase (NADPH)
VTTQICFDAVRVFDWIALIRGSGIELPVYVGIPGAIRRRKLLEVSLRVGVGDSVRFLTKHGNLVARLVRRGGYRPDAFVARAAAFVADPAYGLRGFHVFTFNQIESTERWRREIVDAYGRAGRRTWDGGEHEHGTAS